METPFQDPVQLWLVRSAVVFLAPARLLCGMWLMHWRRVVVALFASLSITPCCLCFAKCLARYFATCHVVEIEDEILTTRTPYTFLQTLPIFREDGPTAQIPYATQLVAKCLCPGAFGQN